MAKEIGISKSGLPPMISPIWKNPFDFGVEEGRTTGFEHKNIEERIYLS